MSSHTSNRWGIFACAVLALLCLGISIHQARVLSPLLEQGRRTEAVIIGFDVNAKGGKKPILRFTTDAGALVEERDLFQMMLFRFDQGETVTVVYDPGDAGIVTIDLGLWTWQQTAFLFFGFVMLGGLGIVLLRSK